MSIQERLQVVIAQEREREQERKKKGELTKYEAFLKAFKEEAEERKNYKPKFKW